MIVAAERKERFAKFTNTEGLDFFEFRKRIENVNGNVRVFVHPLFSLFDTFPETEKDKHRNIYSFFAKSMNILKSRPKSSPVIILEDPRYINNLLSFLKNECNISEDKLLDFGICIFPTFESMGVPNMNHENELPIRLWSDYEKPYFDKLKLFFDEMSIKSIVCGGMYIEPSNQNLKKFNSCLGAFVTYMLDYYEILFTSNIGATQKTLQNELFLTPSSLVSRRVKDRMLKIRK